MDNRPEPIEDEQATFEHQGGRVCAHGFTRAQPDRSGAGEISTVEITDGGSRSGGIPTTVPLGLQQWLGTVTARARDVVRRYPLQVGLGAVGVLLLSNRLRRQKRGG